MPDPWRVDHLLLDNLNPRLPEELFGTANQGELLLHFYAEYDLQELGWSMAERGYFREEPLLVVDGDDPSRRVVVEGNRRVAALKLLTDPAAREQVGASRLWNELADAARDQRLEEVPTVRYDDRADLLEYLGFRHVSGLLAWEADAKARFVYRLVTQHAYDFQRAGRAIGSRADAVRRQFVAWSAIEQARREGVDVDPAVAHFGVFYRALQNPANREFLRLRGWTDATRDLTEPLEPEGIQRLPEFLGWIFGPDRVLTDSRQLDDLAKILSDTQATAILRETRDLPAALQEMPPSRDAVFAAVRLAYRHVTRATGEAWQFTGDAELRAEVRRLRLAAEQLARVVDVTPDAERRAT